MERRPRMTPEELKIYAHDIFKSIPIKEDLLFFANCFDSLVEHSLRDKEFQAFIEKELKAAEIYGDFLYAVKISKYAGMMSDNEVKEIYTEYTTRYADK